jgi:hypothetical protein
MTKRSHADKDKDMTRKLTAEEERLRHQYLKGLPTAEWGPYLSERQWGTVREDYSPDGSAWDYFTHDQARSRAYRWGEDGLAGISDRQGQLCFALALWNGQDLFLKERLFGLNNQEGNHGEDVKELYYYLDNTPTHSYMHYLYKYPVQAFPYSRLLNENKHRTVDDSEYELLDTGLFDDGRYFDVNVFYAKVSEEDICIRIGMTNHSTEEALLVLLPVLWFRKQWAPDLIEGKPQISLDNNGETRHRVKAGHPYIGNYFFYFEKADHLLFTENETNKQLLFNLSNVSPFVKDAFHEAVINNDFSLFGGHHQGTKFSPVYKLILPGGATRTIGLRITRNGELENPFGNDFSKTFNVRKKEADDFYRQVLPVEPGHEIAAISRQAYAGMLWNKQFYYYDVFQWLKGDPGQPAPPFERLTGRNSQWKHLNNRDIVSMPDKWEYPWYAAWDLAFHLVVFAGIDPVFAKNQLILLLREWYTHPNGQLPAYEWNFGDVNPPVHAWAAMRIYEIDKKKTGNGDIDFLKRVFQKLNINFTWWANRKDAEDNYIFEGGFLGLDNIGVIDRDSQLPAGAILEQADGTAWMGMYASYMLEMTLEIALHDPAFEDVATKYYEHYVFITEAFNLNGLWDDDDHFFYDVLKQPDGKRIPLKVRSLVGITSIFTALVIPSEVLDKLVNFRHGLQWFRKYRRRQGEYLALMQHEEKEEGDKLITLVHQHKLEKLLTALFDEDEFLSPFGIRSVSKRHEQTYEVNIAGQTFALSYEPGESHTHIFGGNSNWRGPIWFPMNYLIIRSLKSYYRFFGDNLKMEFPSRSGRYLNLEEIAHELSARLIKIFLPDEKGHRPVFGRYNGFYQRQENAGLLLFHEYFNGDTGMGLGASHQTGWTGLVATLINEMNDIE